MSGPVLRDATPEDAAAIGRLLVRTWRHAYAELLPPDVLEDLDVEERTAALETLIRSAERAGPTLVPPVAWSGVGTPEGGTGRASGASDLALPSLAADVPGATTVIVLVAEVAGEVVGLAAGEAPTAATADAAGGDAVAEGALRALYVAPHAQGAGVGGALLRAATAALRQRGARRLALRTLAGAFWARSLYASAGWTHDEEADEPPLQGAPVERWVLAP